MPKVPISDEERNSPYYKYFERELARVPAEKLRMLEENPLTPETALRIQDINDLFRDGYLPGEFGYTRLKDHTITMANLTAMPRVTVAMFDWWFAWHGLDPMRYKIWDPEDHYYALWRNLAQAKDTNLSMRERYWNNICDVKENIGGGKALKVSLYFSNPADFGFDSKRLADFNGTILCGGGVGFPPIVMCHFLRPTADGCELRTRAWTGWSIKDGKPKRVVFPPPWLMPIKMIRNLLEHNIREYTNLAAILPEVYAEFKDKF